MIWVTWRLYRRPLLLGSGALGVVALVGFLGGLWMDGDFNSSGLASCVAAQDHEGRCASIAVAFAAQYQVLSNFVTTALVALPLIAGMFIGAPLLSQEFSSGTHRLAWTQSVSRYRWTASKLVLVGFVVLAAGVVLSLIGWWWQRPLDQLYGGSFAGFDEEGMTPIAYALFAFALGTAAGTVLRSPVLAMVVTLVGFVATRFAVAVLIRPYYIAPIEVSVDTSKLQGTTLVMGTRFNVNPGQAFAWAGDPRGNSGPGPTHNLSVAFNGDWRFNLDQSGPILSYWVQPADRYLAFQAVESALFIGLAAVLVGLTVWWVRKIS